MSQIIPIKWFAVDVLATPEAADAVEYALNALDALGTEIDSLRKTASEDLKITGYFNALPDAEMLKSEIATGMNIYGVSPETAYSVSTREVVNEDWLAEWKRHWKPTEVGKFVIAPPWSEVASSDKIVIRIEPNMAFGTGTHETTQLCVTAIGDNYTDGESFLDVGTGTGILAIALAKLSAKSEIFACDTDVDSVKIARENAVSNGVGERIEFSDVPISDATPAYDFVCANLTIDVIVPILSLLVEKTKNTLLLSGILAEQESEIIAELLKFENLKFEIAQSGEWISVLIKKS